MERKSYLVAMLLGLVALVWAAPIASQETQGAGAKASAEPAPSASDPEAIAVVEQYLKAIGGRETLAAIRDRVTKFRNIKYSATGETVAVIALYMKDGYRYREEWEIEGVGLRENEPLAFVQIYNGQKLEGWVKMLGTVSPLEGRTLQTFVWDKYLDDFFMHWEEDGFTLKLIGQGLVEGETCDIIEVTDFTGRSKTRYYFSKNTGLLLKKEWIDTTQQGRPKKEQYYKQYRKIVFQDGSGRWVLFPLVHEIYLDGDLDIERRFVEVKFNSGLSDALFERPEGKEFKSPITDSRKFREQLRATQTKGVPHGHGTRGVHGTREGTRGAVEGTRGAVEGTRSPVEGTRSPPSGADAPPEGSRSRTPPPSRKVEAGERKTPESSGESSKTESSGGEAKPE